LDISLRSGSGIDLLKKIKASVPDAAVLVMSMHDESLFAERAIRAGASGYLMKQEASEKLIPAITKVLNGQIFLSERMTAKLVSLTRRSTGATVSAMDTLSAREKEVFCLIGEGYSTRAIADQLRLSVKTIDSYREHLKQKLDLPTGTELVQYAIKWCNAEAATA
jgi:DNA-binding NarL/FixJ family response regulator